jgi:hypothetical protein
MTTQRWITFFAVFALNLSGWILFRRWVTARLAGLFRDPRYQVGLPRSTNPGDFIIEVPRDMAFWMDVVGFVERFWFVSAPLAVVFSFAIALMFPRGGTRADATAARARGQ